MRTSSLSFQFCLGTFLLPLIIANPAAAEEVHEEHRHAEAHVHGEGQLSVATDGSGLELSFLAPTANFLGFEHMPENEDEIAAAEKLYDHLADFDSLFVVNSEAECIVNATSIVAPGIGADGPQEEDAEDHDGHEGHLDDEHANHHGEHEEGHGHEEAEISHSDVEVTYGLTCNAVSSLESLDVKLFDLYPGFSEIEAVYLLEDKQSLQTLEPDSAILMFR